MVSRRLSANSRVVVVQFCFIALVQILLETYFILFILISPKINEACISLIKPALRMA